MMSTLTWNEPRVSWDWPSRPSGFLTRFDDEYNNNYQHDDDDDDNDDDDDDDKEEKDDDKLNLNDDHLYSFLNHLSVRYLPNSSS